MADLYATSLNSGPVGPIGPVGPPGPNTISTSTTVTGAADGDLVYNNSGVVGFLPDVATGSYLASGGVGTRPVWTAFPSIPGGTVTSVDVSGGSTGLTFSGGPITTSGTITMAGTLGAGFGGTGFSTYAKGDTIHASAANTLSKLTIGSTGNVLTVSGGDVVWAAPATSGTVTSIDVSGGTTGLTTSGGPVTSFGTITFAGTLVSANGGTGFSTYTKGDLIHASAANTLSKLGIGSTGNVLTVSGGDTVWAAPATAGTVTSVALTVPTFLSIAGSPITSSGTLAITLSGTALPVVNGGTGSTTQNFVDLTTDQSVVGIKTFSTSIKLATSGGTQSALNYYEELAVINSGISFSNITIGDGTYAFTLTRIGRIVQLIFTLSGTTMKATGSGTVQFLSVLPARFRPATDLYEIIAFDVNGAALAVQMRITSGGTFIFYKSTTQGSYAANDTFVTDGLIGASWSV